MPLTEPCIRIVGQLPDGIHADVPRLQRMQKFDGNVCHETDPHIAFTLKNLGADALSGPSVVIHYLDVHGEVIDVDGQSFIEALAPGAAQPVAILASDCAAATYALITVEATRDDVFQSVKLYVVLLLLFIVVMLVII